MMATKTAVYLLKLEQNKFYVGKTVNLARRMKQHENGHGSMWTRKYKFVSVESVTYVPSSLANFEETKLTCQMFLDYGIESTRGAQFCSTKMFKLSDVDHLVYTIGHNMDMSYSLLRRQIIYEIKNPKF